MHECSGIVCANFKYLCLCEHASCIADIMVFHAGMHESACIGAGMCTHVLPHVLLATLLEPSLKHDRCLSFACAHLHCCWLSALSTPAWLFYNPAPAHQAADMKLLSLQSSRLKLHLPHLSTYCNNRCLAECAWWAMVWTGRPLGLQGPATSWPGLCERCSWQRGPSRGRAVPWWGTRVGAWLAGLAGQSSANPRPQTLSHT